MTTLFWMAVALISLATSLLLVRPVWRSKLERPLLEHDQLNVAIFEDRMKELDIELANGVLTEERYEQARNELQRDLLQNTGSGGVNTVSAEGGRWIAPLLMLLVPALAVGVYLAVGSPGIMEKPPATAEIPAHQGTSDMQMAGDMPTMIQRLQERLAENPQDVDGWVLLGRSMAMLRRYQDAADAYGRAYQLVGDVPEIMAQYAETLALAQNGSFEGRPMELLEKAMQVDPDSPRVLWLQGVVVAQQGESSAAAEIWGRVLASLPPESEAAQMVRSSIERLGSSQQAAAVPTRRSAGEDSSSAPSSGGAVKLQVSIAPDLKEKLSPDDILFIIARPVEGARMPIAVARHKASELPLNVTLDDSMSMAGQKLSNFDQVSIVARVSKGATAAPRPGDLEGEIRAVPGAAHAVSIEIDTVLPD